MPSLTPITSLPDFITPDEHQNVVSSTPASFNDIRPVLKHKEDNVAVTLDPPIIGFSSTEPTQGALYILTSVLVFISASGRGFEINYPSITLHAISRGGQMPCIYCQLDENVSETLPLPQAEEDGPTSMRELNIIPEKAESLDTIFESLSICASLHPDPGADEEDFDDDAFVDSSAFETFAGDGDQELSEVGRAALAHLESIIDNPFEHLSAANGSENDEETTDQQPSLSRKDDS